MAWIESHQSIKDHYKTLHLASLMGWDVYSTIGRLHCFWWWCLDYAPTGDLRKFNDSILAQSVGLNASEGKAFVDAMVESCWIDRGRNVFRVHDWVEYAGRYLRDTKFKSKPEKWEEIKALYRVGYQPKVSRKSAESQLYQPTNLTNLTNQPNNVDFNFEEVWNQYPNKDGRKDALRHFNATVKTVEDFEAIKRALSNYLQSERVQKGFIKNGSTWFNNWRDWINPSAEQLSGGDNGRGAGSTGKAGKAQGGSEDAAAKYAGIGEKLAL